MFFISCGENVLVLKVAPKSSTTSKLPHHPRFSSGRGNFVLPRVGVEIVGCNIFLPKAISSPRVVVKKFRVGHSKSIFYPLGTTLNIFFKKRSIICNVPHRKTNSQNSLFTFTFKSFIHSFNSFIYLYICILY